MQTSNTQKRLRPSHSASSELETNAKNDQTSLEFHEDESFKRQKTTDAFTEKEDYCRAPPVIVIEDEEMNQVH